MNDLSVVVKQTTERLAEIVKKIPTRAVSISQTRSWMQCKRKWALQRTFPEDFSQEFFAVGKAVHKGLEDYYGKKPLAIALEEAKKELKISDTQDFTDQWELVEHMLTGYINFNERNPDYEIIATELEFELPLGYSLDELENMSEEEYKNISKAKGVIDFIAVTKRDVELPNGEIIPKGEVIVGEYKTASRAGNIDYDLDNQASLYLLVLSELLGMHIRYIVFNTLYKKMPKEPAILKSGDVSAQAIVTTQEIYGNTLIKVYGSIEDAPEKCQSLYYKLAGSDASFFGRQYVHRSQEELNSISDTLRTIIPQLNKDYDAISADFENTGKYNFGHCYPNPGRDCSTMCERRDQCIAMNRKEELPALNPFAVNLKISSQEIKDSSAKAVTEEVK